MIARFKSLILVLLCTANLATLAIAQRIEGILEDWREACSYAMHSEASLEAADGYNRRFSKFAGAEGIAQLRILVEVGGVLVGRPPEPLIAGAPIEPLGVPEFNYEIVASEGEQPERVRMSFGTADGTKWKFVVPAVVVPVMTAVAIDDIGVIYTLTGSTPEEDKQLLKEELLKLVKSEEFQKYERTKDLEGMEKLFKQAKKQWKEKVRAARNLVHPALAGSRFCFRPAVFDLFADNRISDSTRDNLNSWASQLAEGKRLLSFIEEKTWSLSPENLRPPDVLKSPLDSVVEFKHRVVFERGKLDDAANLFESKFVEEINREVLGSINSASECKLFQEFTDAVIVHRIAHEVLAGRIINFPYKKWSEMLRELQDVDKENRDASTKQMRSRAEVWRSDSQLDFNLELR
jgi:hypothetical protein